MLLISVSEQAQKQIKDTSGRSGTVSYTNKLSWLYYHYRTSKDYKDNNKDKHAQCPV